MRSKADLNALFLRASRLWDEGDLRAAYRTFLLGARLGDVGAQLTVGYFFDNGVGVRRSGAKAVYWYRRAIRRGNFAAANNLGTLYRDEGRWELAERWLRRAIALGDDDANLNLAKMLKKLPGRGREVLPLLRAVVRSNSATPASQEEARRLIRRYRKPNRLSPKPSAGHGKRRP